MGLRYNCELITVESGGDEAEHLWISRNEVVAIVRQLRDGDDLVIHAVEDGE